MPLLSFTADVSVELGADFAKAWSFWRVRKAAPFLPEFWLAPSMADAQMLLQQRDKEQVSVVGGSGDVGNGCRSACINIEC
jgi:hypothetical protein